MDRSASVDIAIAGAGHTALTAALTLASALPQRRIALLSGAQPEGGADPRVTALSGSSREIFSALGCWSAIVARSAPITDICVSESRAPLRAHLGPSSGAAFGQVIANHHLTECLTEAVAGLANVAYLPAATGALQFRADACGVAVAGGAVETRLLVIADGAESPLREHLGMAVERRDYGVSALLAEVVLAAPHGGLALEHFTPSGPLALLPLPARGGARARRPGLGVAS